MKYLKIYDFIKYIINAFNIFITLLIQEIIIVKEMLFFNAYRNTFIMLVRNDNTSLKKKINEQSGRND